MAYLVMNGLNSGNGSLRDGIDNGFTIITFDPTVTTINITSELLVDTNGISIDGGPLGVTVDAGGNPGPIFHVVNVTGIIFLNLVIRNTLLGLLPVPGAVFVENSTVNIFNCTIENNNAGGGIQTISSDVTISYSNISNNIAGLRGGIYIGTGSILRLLHCLVNENLATNGAGIFVDANGNLVIQNSTIANNQATSSGGGIYCLGEGFITNATISGNQAAASGGGIRFDAGVATGLLTIGNTIIAENMAPAGPDVFGVITSVGYNLVGNNLGSGGFGVMGDQVGTPQNPIDPELAPLANNGGPTFTMGLMAQSPAINTGSIALLPPPPEDEFDQRGPGFPRVINGGVDIGAFEFVAAVICYGGGSILMVRNRLTGEESKMPVKDIVAANYDVYSISQNKFVPIRSNVVTGTVNRLIKIDADSLGKDQPILDFNITSGHRLVVNGLEIKARHLPQAKRIKVKPQYVYSICTDKRCTIWVNGLEVMTWSYQKWLSRAASKGISWMENSPQKRLGLQEI